MTTLRAENTIRAWFISKQGGEGMMRSPFLGALGLAALLSSASGAWAASSAAAYDTAATTAGNQAWGGVLGNDFTVNRAGLVVTALGAFDSGRDGISTDITVRLYDITGGGWATSALNLNGTANASHSSYVFKSIAPVALLSGHTYSIEAWGFNGTDLNYNTNDAGTNGHSPITFNTFGGAISNGTSRWDFGQNTLASIVHPYASTFGAGSLVVAVPEPETYAMMMVGLGLLGSMARRKKKAA